MTAASVSSTAPVAVIGAGVMGVGVAQTLAQSGRRVILVDLSDEVLGRAREEILRGMKMQRLFNRDAPSEPADAVLERIRFTTDLTDAADAGFVVENVTEKWEVKKEVYPVLDRVCPAECVLAADTSAIPITRIASLTGRPDRVIGLHFMNPVPLKSTAEVIRGHHTSQATIDATMQLLADIGKEGILVEDSPGFVSNRVLMLTVNEAVFLVHEGVAPAEDVDRIFKSCFGHKMGPLETADLIGLDTILYSLDVLYDSFNDSKYRPCPLLKRMVDAGLFGRKSGQGFYDYRAGGPPRGDAHG